jgi:hypothetical protein
MIVWSVVNDPFVQYTSVEDQEDFEQQHAWVKGKSLLHSLLSYYNMHFNYIVIYLLLASIWWDLCLRFDYYCLPYALINRVYFMLGSFARANFGWFELNNH